MIAKNLTLSVKREIVYAPFQEMLQAFADGKLPPPNEPTAEELVGSQAINLPVSDTSADTAPIDEVYTSGSQYLSDSLGRLHTTYSFEEFKIAISSEFATLNNDATGNMSSLFAGLAKEKGESFSGLAAGLASGKNAASAILLWQSSSPAVISCKAVYAYKANAYYDVLVPAIAWMVLPLPSINSLGSLLPPGPTMYDVLKLSAGAFVNYAQKKRKSATISVGHSLQWGPIPLGNVILTKANPTFSKETDTEGYPAYCELELEFSTSSVATKGVLLNMLKKTVKEAGSGL